jgi:hypothetical protein
MAKPGETNQWSHIPIWVRVALAVLMIDIISFYVGSVILGGDAARGYHRNGKYYLADRYGAVEVSRSVYYYSTIHLLTVGVVLVVAAVGIKKTPNRPKFVSAR